MFIGKTLKFSPTMLLFLLLALGFEFSPLRANPPEDGAIRLVQRDRSRRPGGRFRRSPQERQKMARERFERMCKYLELTEQQKKEAEALFKARGKELKELFSDLRSGKIERSQLRESMQKIQREFQEKFQALLTEQQRAKLEKWRKEHPRIGQRPGDPKASPEPQGLNLDESLKKKLAELSAEHRENLRQLRTRVESGELDREGFRKAVEEENVRFQAGLKEFLTEEQIEQLNTLRARRRTPGTGLYGVLTSLKLLKKLDLSDQQTEKLTRAGRLLRKHLRDLREKLNSGELSRQEYRQKAAQATRRFEKLLKGTLSQEQLQQFRALRARASRRMAGGPAHARSPLARLVSTMKKRLELDEQQLEEIHKKAQPYREKIKELWSNARKEGLAPKAVKEQIGPLLESFLQEVSAILTPEQKEKLEQLKQRLESRSENGEKSNGAALLSGSETSLPQAFELFQNSPNPFNPSTTITYSVPSTDGAVPVDLTVYDVRGREVVKLVSAIQEPGTYRVVWDGRNAQGQRVNSGVYFYRLRAGKFNQTRKMIILK